MIEFSNGGKMVTELSELPGPRAGTIFLDIETTSSDPEIKALNPWDVEHCRVCGIAVKWPGTPAYYIPRKFLNASYINKLLSTSYRWVNHNLKYDLHVLMNDMGVDHYKGDMIDTVTLAKIIDSDRGYKGGYGLDALVSAWVGIDISGYEKRMAPYLASSDDYGDVPADILGEYACMDVIVNELLYEYIDQNMPTECRELERTEIDLTKVLFDIERRGLCVNSQSLKLARIGSVTKMLEISSRLHSILGYSMSPVSNTDCFDLLCNRYGLPILKVTKDIGNPSFTRDVLEEYLYYPEAPEDLLMDLLEYRRQSTLDGLFWQAWLRLNLDGILHSDYNQSVRSGRMSCRNPNVQQLNKQAKKQIFPRPGYTFISMDYSQIEYRLIVHYIEDAKSIKAYSDDPDTDFHMWVASLCNVGRTPAKTLNFGMAYGAGKGKVLLMLKSSLKSSSDAFANEVFLRYHRALPSLKSTARRAGTAAKYRGYVFNAHGRRLHLPFDKTWLAFNRVVQSEAADLAKERAIVVSPTFNSWLKSHDVHLVAVVHDEFLFEVPHEVIELVEPMLRNWLQQSRVKYQVPIRVSTSLSRESWGLVSDKNRCISVY